MRKYPRKINSAGHTKALFVGNINTSCGRIGKGIAFHFDGESSWVVSLSELKKLVRDAEAK